jgi:prevent-host-death family protein
MDTIGVRDLSRHPADVIDEVERTGRPVLVTRRGRPAVALVAVNPEELEDFILANAPEFVRGMGLADQELAAGETRPLGEVLSEIRHGGEPESLADHLRRALAGGGPPTLADRLAADCFVSALQVAESITSREREVLEFVNRGMTTKAIAAELRIEPTTVRTHLHSIFAKLEAASSGDLTERR